MMPCGTNTLKPKRLPALVRYAREAMLLIAFMVVAHGAKAASITDDRGITVHLAAPPQRIVSILPSLSETVCELGLCHRLVGVDRYSNYPVALQKLAQVGGGLDPSVEAIVALRPDVVLMATSARVAERLEALGIRVVAMEPKTHADVQRVILALGQFLDVPDAPHIWRRIDAAVNAAAQSLPASTRGVKVYFEASQGPYAASESSFIGETLTRLGVGNIVPAALGPFPKLNPEFVVRANPGLIMIAERSVAGLVERPGWRQLRALREQRVCGFTPQEADILVRAGPRMAQAARLMAQCIEAKAPQGGH